MDFARVASTSIAQSAKEKCLPVLQANQDVFSYSSQTTRMRSVGYNLSSILNAVPCFANTSNLRCACDLRRHVWKEGGPSHGAEGARTTGSIELHYRFWGASGQDKLNGSAQKRGIEHLSCIQLINCTVATRVLWKPNQLRKPRLAAEMDPKIKALEDHYKQLLQFQTDAVLDAGSPPSRTPMLNNNPGFRV